MYCYVLCVSSGASPPAFCVFGHSLSFSAATRAMLYFQFCLGSRLVWLQLGFSGRAGGVKKLCVFMASAAMIIYWFSLLQSRYMMGMRARLQDPNDEKLKQVDNSTVRNQHMFCTCQFVFAFVCSFSGASSSP